MSQTISKANIAAEIANAEGQTLSKTAVERVVDDALDLIGRHLKAGNEVRLHRFGTFSQTSRPARMGRNPKTGEPVEIPARNAVKFKASSAFKDAVN